jgi:hypothetical protein
MPDTGALLTAAVECIVRLQRASLHDGRDTPMIEGGCFCRKIRYAIDDGAYLSVNCHCTMCRHVHAAPYVTWLVVPAERFRYLANAPTRLDSSPDGARYYCAACGTHVACVNAGHPEIVDVATGSLDAPERFEPTHEVYADTRLAWVRPVRHED